MPDRVEAWQAEFSKARGETAQIQSELQQWELLGTQSSAQRCERAKLGTSIRGRVSQLKHQYDKLKRDLDGLSGQQKENEVTRKSVTEYRDSLNQALEEFTELQRRVKGTPSASPDRVPPSPGSSFQSSPGTSFQRMGDDGVVRAPGGAELQPVSQRTKIQQQQAVMRSFDEPLTTLEGTLNNLKNSSGLIQAELGLHNEMLAATNEATERTQNRMNRTISSVRRFGSMSSNRKLICMIVLLLVALVVILLYIVMP